MKQACSCGFILAEPLGWLLCHLTHNGNHWDFPKGHTEPSEAHLQTAIIDLLEETGISLTTTTTVQDLGQHPYLPKKDLHLFNLKLDQVDVSLMKCSSMVTLHWRPYFTEMDAFTIFPVDKALLKLSKRLNDWLKAHSTLSEASFKNLIFVV